MRKEQPSGGFSPHLPDKGALGFSRQEWDDAFAAAETLAGEIGMEFLLRVARQGNYILASVECDPPLSVIGYGDDLQSCLEALIEGVQLMKGAGWPRIDGETLQ